MVLLVLLPLACFVLLWGAVHDGRGRLGLAQLSSRGTFVVAYAVLNGLVLAIGELTSIGRHLTTATVAVSWAMAVVVLFGLAEGRPPLVPFPRGLGFAERVAGTLTGAYVGILAVTAALYRPATRDSMVYHLVRVEHWIQDASVAPYATHFLPQIDLSPLHEYSLTHLHLLAGTDRLDAFVQLFAYVVCAVAASEATRLLGGSRRAQLLAPLLAITVPVAILQATSTQNDLFGAAIGLCLLVVILGWDPKGPVVPRAVALGLCAGLAVVAKGQVVPIVGPAVAGLTFLAARRELRARGGGARGLAAIAGVALVAASLTAGPFLVRNQALFGSPTGGDQDHLRVEGITFASAGANTVRSVAGNFRIGNGSSGVEYWVGRAARAVGSDAFDLFGIAPDDSRYVIGNEVDLFAERDYRIYQRWSEHGANPWHVLLLSVSGVALLVSFVRGRLDGRHLVLLIGLSIGFVLFATLVRWQMYGVRFQLPGLMAWCPLIAITLDRWGRVAAHAVIGLLVVASLPMLVHNAERPLLHGTFDADLPYLQRYLPRGAGSAATAADYDAVAEVVASSTCDRLGMASWIELEYLLWVALRHHGWHGEIRAVDVVNESEELLDDGFEPCATLRTVRKGRPASDAAEGQLRTGELRFGELVLAFDPDASPGRGASSDGSKPTW